MKRIVSLLVLITFICQSCPVLAADGIFFNYSVAKKLAVEREFQKRKIENQSLVINNYSSAYNKLSEKSSQLELKSATLMEDKEVLKKVNISCQQELRNSPSRLTWFGTGVVATLVGTLLATIYIK